MSRRHRPPGPPSGSAGARLDDALTSLRRVTELGEGRVAPDLLAPAHALLRRAAERRSLAPEVTVVALAGATGAGKSSLLNALAGAEIARTAVIRPTTTRPLAVMEPTTLTSCTRLLDWLGVEERAVVTELGGPGAGLGAGLGAGTVLLDLPDIDSDEPAHRATATRLAGLVDVLVWVLDPEKYADGVVHRDFLTPMAAHAEVTLVVLNQADRLTDADAAAVLADVSHLLASEGLHAQVEAVSARTGQGVAALSARVAELAARRTAAYERLSADVRTEALRLAEALDLPGAGGAGQVEGADLERLLAAARRAVGVDAVAGAVAASDRLRAGQKVGWLPVRWLARLRRDPLRRLHLAGGPVPPGAGSDLVEVVARSSLPAPGPVSTGVLTSALHTVVAGATTPLPADAASRVLERVDAWVPDLVEALDVAVGSADVEAGRSPAWWSVANGAQWLCLLTALAGGLWLAGAVLVERLLLLARPSVPHLGSVPWPTVLLLGGLVLGALLASVGTGLARLGAARRRARVRRRLASAVDAVVEEQVVAPLDADLATWREMAALLPVLAGRLPRPDR